jgi:hypothetical protein
LHCSSNIIVHPTSLFIQHLLGTKCFEIFFNFYFDSFSLRIMYFGRKLYSYSILGFKKKKINKIGERKQLIVYIKLTKKKLILIINEFH